MFAVGVAIVSAAALAVVEWPYIRAWYRPPVAALPAPDEAVRMQAAVWASGSRGNLESDVPWFEVPEAVAPRLIRRFTPNTYLPRSGVNVDTPLGELAVTAADGRVSRIRFYETGGDDLVFTVDGEHFFQAEPRDERGHPLGGALFLAGTLRHASITASFPDPGPPTAPGPSHWPLAGFVTPR